MAILRLAMLVLLLLGAPVARAAENPDSVLERRVKAAFLWKFAGYVEWPSAAFAQPDSPIVIAVAGSDALADDVEEAVSGRRVGERPMRVRRLRAEGRLEGNHILFIARSVDRARTAELLGLAGGKPMLTVTESEHAPPPGSVINFFSVEDRVRFDISREAAEQNGLRLASQLLAVARQVKGRDR
jgi:hypothetical protein